MYVWAPEVVTVPPLIRVAPPTVTEPTAKAPAPPTAPPNTASSETDRPLRDATAFLNSASPVTPRLNPPPPSASSNVTEEPVSCVFPANTASSWYFWVPVVVMVDASSTVPPTLVSTLPTLIALLSRVTPLVLTFSAKGPAAPALKFTSPAPELVSVVSAPRTSWSL